jgi:hypothetical protein
MQDYVRLGRAVIGDAIRSLRENWNNNDGRGKRPNVSARRDAEFFFDSEQVDFWADVAEIPVENVKAEARKIIEERERAEGGALSDIERWRKRHAGDTKPKGLMRKRMLGPGEARGEEAR